MLLEVINNLTITGTGFLLCTADDYQLGAGSSRCLHLFVKAADSTGILGHHKLAAILFQHSDIQLFAERSLHTDNMRRLVTKLKSNLQAAFQRQDTQNDTLGVIMHSGEVRQILASGSQEDAAVQMIQKLNCFRKIVNGNVIAALARRTHQAQIFNLLCAAGLLHRCGNNGSIRMRSVDNAGRAMLPNKGTHSRKVHTLCHNGHSRLRLN